ncbi:hypothetical protein F5B22DRAFT_656085 [Xylaria bambusicola]|uniref:uncharacterized protein n=1 Tax=Xylaria bambusicola TaxID=326684 RepID=UPI00200742CB|nr:uncharacterized protein F5B22DRAFT_656085 [Xylaria bambusicola]KAI0515390.1 hypothetical protein F5B22DRAFT_656085 [Xylaria bambusicola]
MSITTELANSVPTSPDEYQGWLQHMRDEYSDIAKTFEEGLFTISMDEFVDKPGCEDTATAHVSDKERALGDLKPVLSTGYYMPPPSEFDISEAYIFDLDREIFGIHNYGFYHMSQIPRPFPSLLYQARNYWLVKVRYSGTPRCITTDDVQSIPLTHDPTLAFSQLKPTTVIPKKDSKLSHMPCFVAFKRLYELFIKRYNDELREAQDCCVESDFLFKELVFAFLCFTSCSPEWLRIVSGPDILHKASNRWESWAYGAILDNESRKPKEFTTIFLRGFHVEGREAGSAPKSTSYWFSGVLVYLRRDITSRGKFQDAIVSAVERGKADGQTHFHAIIISLKHFILLKFADGSVQHTKRFNVNERPGRIKEKDLPSTSDVAQDDPDHDWSENADVAVFDIMAHFFDAVQNEGLKPTTMHNEGVFPNEVYQRIIHHADLQTNTACHKVSRVFRDIASKTFIMRGGLKLVYRAGKEPECFSDTLGSVGRFSPKISYKSPFTTWGIFPYRREPRTETIMWIPVFGKPDGSASAAPNIVLELPSKGPSSGFIPNRPSRRRTFVVD